MSAHWHGFVDAESGIATYTWCVGATKHTNNRNIEKTECTILPWVNVGLHVSASRNVSSNIPQGKPYRDGLLFLAILLTFYSNLSLKMNDIHCRFCTIRYFYFCQISLKICQERLFDCFLCHKKGCHD